MLVSAEVPLPAIRPRFIGNTDRPRPSHKRGHIRAADYCERARAASQTAIKEFQPAIKELLRTLYRQSANLFVGGTMSAMISNFPTPATPRQDQPGPKGPIHQTNQHREG